MPVAILIAVFVALFTFGANMNKQKNSAAAIEVMEAKKYQQVVIEQAPQQVAVPEQQVTMPEQRVKTSATQEQPEAGAFDNIFQFSGLYQIIKAEPMNVIRESINSNVKQAIGLYEKE